MKQTGLLIEIRPKDYILGAWSPLIWEILLSTGNWNKYVPADEAQSTFSFDTMSCTTFSILSAIETVLNFLLKENKITPEQLAVFNSLGVIIDGKFNFSDRFSAIMSGTTKNGNWHQNVLDSIKKVGLLSENDLPMGGNTWEEYHDKTLITPAMIEKAKLILDIFDLAYEWIPVDKNSLRDALKYSPILVAVTKENPRHAIMKPRSTYEFETYKPFLRRKNRSVAYALRIQIKLKNPTPKPVVPLVMLNRKSDDGVQTLGELTYNDFKCKTLERPWKNNQVNVSCIPRGAYLAKWTFSPKFLKYTYELQKVDKRSGIRLHSGNFFFDIEGCILVGDSYSDINSDGKVDVLNSRVTIKKLEDLLERKDFYLVIQ